MTVLNLVPNITYETGGVEYSFGFQFQNNEDIIVKLTDPLGSESLLEEGVDYTLVNGEPGGTVTLSVEPEAGSSLYIYRSTDLSQATDLPATGVLPVEVVERMIDRVVMMVQEIVLSGSDLLVNSLTIKDWKLSQEGNNIVTDKDGERQGFYIAPTAAETEEA